MATINVIVANLFLYSVCKIIVLNLPFCSHLLRGLQLHFDMACGTCYSLIIFPGIFPFANLFNKKITCLS